MEQTRIVTTKTERALKTTKGMGFFQKMLKKPPIKVAAYNNDHTKDVYLKRLDLARIAFVALAICASWLGFWKELANFDVIGLVATLIGGYPIFREAFTALISRRMTMELSMTIALGAALVIGEFFTALVIVLFVLVAEVLEHLTANRGRRAIKNLLELLPQVAFVRRNGQAKEIRSKDIKPNDIVIIKPGARVPVDGIVTFGNSFIDQSAITGESMPVEKVRGSQVYAGTINQSGMLEVRAVKLGHDTAFGKIVEAVEQAEKSRAPIQKTADRLAGYLVYFALACAAITYLITHDIRSTISVIIVAGACGIAAGTPLAILGVIGRAARLGAIVKGGLYIENLSTIDTVLLDKTGTLTFGEPEVVDIRPSSGVTTEALLEAAAIAERPSEHILAKAILKEASEMSLSITEPEQFEYIPGEGIICTVDREEIIVGNRTLFERLSHKIGEIPRSPDQFSEVLVARGGRYLGSLHIADVLRPEAAEAVGRLQQMGIRTVLLTGDRTEIANAIGEKLGVNEVYGELLPDQKLTKVKALISEGKKVAMIGDGINDAPALMRASIGVAMGSGTDVARESSNIVLIGNDLLTFVKVLRIAIQCRQIIMTNFVGTLLVDSVGVGLAAFGLLNPLLAAFIHVSSELAFILNSARLFPAVSKNGFGKEQLSQKSQIEVLSGLSKQISRTLRKHYWLFIIMNRLLRSFGFCRSQRRFTALIRFLCTTSIALGVCVSPVFSQDGNVFISFDQLSEFAIKHSPEAKVMEQTYNLNVTEGQLDLQWSNPLIGYSQEFVKDQSREEREQYLIVSKQFEMPWVYSLRRKSWEFESEAAEYKKEQKLKDFIGEVKTGYADIKLMEEQVEGLNHVKKLITNVSEIAKNQLEEGAISGVEHHFIQMALFNVNSRLLQLEQKKHLLEGEWKAKIGVDETDAVYITTKIDFKPVVVKSTDYYLSLIPTTLGFQQRDKMKEAIQKRIKLERMRVFPYFDLFAGYKRINPDLNGYVVGIALPLPILNTNKPQIRKQKIERDLIESDLVSYRLQLQQQIKTKLNAIQEYLGSLEEITPQLASVKERIGRIFFSYKEGQISLVEALNATQIYSESIEQYYEQLRNYYRNIFQLEAMINRQLVTF